MEEDKKRKVEMNIVNILYIIILIPALMLGILIALIPWMNRIMYPEFYDAMTILYIFRNIVSFIPLIIMVTYTRNIIKETKIDFQNEKIKSKIRKNYINRIAIQIIIMFLLLCTVSFVAGNAHDHEEPEFAEYQIKDINYSNIKFK